MQKKHPQAPATVTFIHTADWQLGKPFGRIENVAKRHRIQQERFDVIRRIATVVEDRRARFVVVAGDLFDSPTPTHDTVSAALAAIGSIGVPVFVLPGNHDPGGRNSLWSEPFFQRERTRLAPNLHLLDSPVPTSVPLEDRGDGIQGVTLLPCPLLRRREAEDPTSWIRALDFAEFGDAPRIVVAHGSVTSFVAAGAGGHDEDDGDPAGVGNTIELDRLPREEIDFIALGDWHGFVTVGANGAYSGSPETDRFPKGDQQPGHVACVTVGRGSPPSVAAVQTGRLRWITLDVTLDAAGDGDGEGVPDRYRGPAYLDDVLTQATQPRDAGEPGFEGCLVRVVLKGSVSLADRLELERVLESWDSRLLRFDLDNAVRIEPTREEIRDLASRPGDPIISRVAEELLRRLEESQGGAAKPITDPDVVRRALAILHGLAHPNRPTATPVTLGPQTTPISGATLP